MLLIFVFVYLRMSNDVNLSTLNSNSLTLKVNDIFLFTVKMAYFHIKAHVLLNRNWYLQPYHIIAWYFDRNRCLVQSLFKKKSGKRESKTQLTIQNTVQCWLHLNYIHHHIQRIEMWWLLTTWHLASLRAPHHEIFVIPVSSWLRLFNNLFLFGFRSSFIAIHRRFKKKTRASIVHFCDTTFLFIFLASF